MTQHCDTSYSDGIRRTANERRKETTRHRPTHGTTQGDDDYDMERQYGTTKWHDNTARHGTTRNDMERQDGTTRFNTATQDMTER